jgi:hypothetical protein
LRVVAHRRHRLAADVEPQEPTEIAALDEDIGIEIEQAAVFAREGRGQQQPKIGRLRAPRIEPQPRQRAFGVDPASPRILDAGDLCNILGRTQADVEVARRGEPCQLIRSHQRALRVGAVAGEHDGRVAFRAARTGGNLHLGQPPAGSLPFENLGEHDARRLLQRITVRSSGKRSR